MKYIAASPDKLKLLVSFDSAGNIIPKTAQEVQRETGALMVVNAAYFTPASDPAKRTPVGQLIVDGRHLVWPNDQVAHFHAVYLKYGEVRFWQWVEADATWGLRAGPRLIEAGEVSPNCLDKSGWPNDILHTAKARPAIARTHDGKIALCFWERTTPYEAAQELRQLRHVEALAFDGGSSAQCACADGYSYGGTPVPVLTGIFGDEPAANPDLPAVNLDLDFSRHLTANFTLAEFACKCCGAVSISPKFAELVARLQMLRDRVGPVRVTSGYRCAKHDGEVGTSGDPGRGPHTTGTAADIYVSNLGIDTLAEHAKDCGFTGIGKYRAQGFVHVDLRQPMSEWEA